MKLETAYKNLLKGIKKHGVGEQDLSQIVEHGVGTGWPGFTYYEDTSEFYDEYAEEIWELLNDAAEGQGLSPIALINSFRDAKDITDDGIFKNTLAWFALEEVARWFTEQEEEAEGAEEEEKEASE